MAPPYPKKADMASSSVTGTERPSGVRHCTGEPVRRTPPEKVAAGSGVPPKTTSGVIDPASPPPPPLTPISSSTAEAGDASHGCEPSGDHCTNSAYRPAQKSTSPALAASRAATTAEGGASYPSSRIQLATCFESFFFFQKKKR